MNYPSLTENDDSAIAQLWKAKVFRMLCDALGFVGAGMKPKDKQKCVAEARHWFYDERYEDEFEETCISAGYNPEQVKTAAIKLITAKQTGDHSRIPEYWRQAFRDGRMPSFTAYTEALAKHKKVE